MRSVHAPFRILGATLLLSSCNFDLPVTADVGATDADASIAIARVDRNAMTRGPGASFAARGGTRGDDAQAGSHAEPRPAGSAASRDGGVRDASDLQPAGWDLDETRSPPEIPSNGEICDGLDNDHNGRVDDADVEGDGVCDCLRIATIGSSGLWGGERVFRDWPNARAQHAVTALGNRTLTAELLAPFQIIIVLDVADHSEDLMVGTPPAHHAFTPSEVAAFAAWARDGGGVIATAGYRTNEADEVSNVNRLLAPFAMGFSASKLDVDGYVEHWTEHALTQGVTRVYTYNGIEPDGRNAKTLATDEQDHAVLQVSLTQDARVVAWGDDWVTYASQWKTHSDQQVERFWLNIFAWLAPVGGCQTQRSMR